eukprot:sb/3478942/
MVRVRQMTVKGGQVVTGDPAGGEATTEAEAELDIVVPTEHSTDTLETHERKWLPTSPRSSDLDKILSQCHICRTGRSLRSASSQRGNRHHFFFSLCL